jgi:Zn-finger nucleic acid-binding protein
MKCPICKLDTLVSTQLHQGPPACQCSRCQGIFLPSTSYYAWLKTQQLEPEIPLADTDVIRVDESAPRLCPECGHLLTRYKVWPDVPFFMDACGHCNGIWLDRDEWQALQKHHLHNRLNLFLTHPGQQKIRYAEAQHRFDALYRQRFGEADYARIQEIRAWLSGHKQRAALLAYLRSEDPYKP